jgi:hypothetical protein
LPSAIARSDAGTDGNPAINGQLFTFRCCDRDADGHTYTDTLSHRDAYTDGKHVTRSIADGHPNS